MAATATTSRGSLNFGFEPYSTQGGLGVVGAYGDRQCARMAHTDTRASPSARPAEFGLEGCCHSLGCKYDGRKDGYEMVDEMARTSSYIAHHLYLPERLLCQCRQNTGIDGSSRWALPRLGGDARMDDVLVS